MKKLYVQLLIIVCAIGTRGGLPASADDLSPDYSKHIAPILNKYCAGCHNAEDREGKLSLESFADLQKGGERGPAVLPGDAGASRLIRVLTGQAEPKMPPEDNEAPKPDEIALLTAWVATGAKGPDGAEPDRRSLITPKIAPPDDLRRAIASLDWSPDGKLLAAARFGEVELLDPTGKRVIRTLGDHPGKVNSVKFTRDGKRLVTGSGVAGLYGEARIYSATNGRLVRTISGHRDTLYAAVPSPDGKLLATGSYDRKIILWDAGTGKPVRELLGHNGAIYDLAFSPDGKILASASGDHTSKIWQVATGRRLDTLNQPLKEQLAVALSPDNRRVLSAGVDNRIRVWELVSRTKQQINPMLYARFAHEASILRLAYSADGSTLATAGEDRLVKLWETKTFTQTHVYELQPDVPHALAISPDGKRLAVGRMDGSLAIYPILAGPNDDSPADTAEIKSASPAAQDDAPPAKLAEKEPNDQPRSATPTATPASITGVIASHAADQPPDVDLFRFKSQAGQRWMLEVNAARSKSPLDSRIEVLNAEGDSIPRVLLRAVRDSYVTFRGVNSTNRQFRLHNWEEMDLNQYLYTEGEVNKLYLYPRGPDSGFEMYPHAGSRRCYFGTTAMSHALHTTSYIVEPHPPGTTLPPNGLPVFTMHYENDDDSLRKLGGDSRLMFVAPADGEFLARVTDVRGFGGDDFKYTLTIRPARPDFKVTLGGAKPTINAGSGKEFTVTAERIDGFDGEIRVDIRGLPPGLAATTPLVIQAGHEIARGTINATMGTKEVTPEAAKAVEVTATAIVEGQEVSKKVNNFGELKLAGQPKILIQLSPPGVQLRPPTEIPTPPEIVITPGETITATLRVVRHEFKERVQFESLALNLPHGVIIDNVGLNGVLIPEGQTERTIYLTAAKWVPETSRTFYLKAKEDGTQTSWPMVLHVRNSGNVANGK